MMERKTRYMPIWGRHVEVLDQLTEEELGLLVHGMMHYHFDDKEPEFTGNVEIYWNFIRQDLDNARDNYEKKAQIGRKGGLRSGEVRRAKKEALESKRKQNEQIESESEEESKYESEKDTESDSCFAPAAAGISVEKKAYGEFGWVKLTDKQYRCLQAKMGEHTLQECIRYMDRAAQATGNRNRWRDWQVMLTRCYEDGWYLRGGSQKPSVPKGASGKLGEAELEAIRRVLAQDFPEPLEEAGATG